MADNLHMVTSHMNLECSEHLRHVCVQLLGHSNRPSLCTQKPPYLKPVLRYIGLFSLCNRFKSRSAPNSAEIMDMLLNASHKRFRVLV
jgi:hypothetical protein